MRTRSLFWAVTAAVGALLGSAVPFAGSANAAPPTGTLQVQWDINNYASLFGGTAVGGEFQVQNLTDPSNALAIQDVSRRAGGAFFQTFCAQLHEDIWNGPTYNWSLETAFSGGEVLQPGTAYLYSRFWDGSLAGYSYTAGPNRIASATALQLAIWKIQGQLTGMFQTAYDGNGQAQSWVAAAAGASGIGNVRVLVMTDAAGNAVQDLLTMIPPPPPPPEECCGYKELTFTYNGPADCVKISAIDPAHCGGYYKTSLSCYGSARPGQSFTVYAGGTWTSGKFPDLFKLVVKNKCGSVIECTSINTSCKPPLVVGTVYGSFTLTGFREADCNPKPTCEQGTWKCGSYSWDSSKRCWSRDGSSYDRYSRYDKSDSDWCGTKDGRDRGELKDCIDWNTLKTCRDFKDSDGGSRSFKFFDSSSWGSRWSNCRD